MRLTARARYALRLMIDLADHDQGSPVILREVAARQRISKRYLEQVATGLRNAKLISASPGHGGGYTLQRPAHEIRVLDIITAAIGPLEIVGCVGAPHLCVEAADCPSRKMWARVNEVITDLFKNVPLSELRERRRGPIPLTNTSTPCTSASK